MKNAMLLTDGYKLGHRNQYPEGTEYVYSTWIPRSNQYLPEANGAVVFGLQYMIKEYFIKYFNEHFFNRPKEDVLKEFHDTVNEYLGENNVGVDHVSDLHDLGYLPVRLKALPEGSICPIHVPAFTIINTDPKFFWITNFLETIISNVIWMPMTSATIANIYKKELIKHSKKTGFYDEGLINFLCHDFSMRGMAGLDASIASGMAHLTSFTGSETIPAIEACKEYYNAKDAFICGTLPASEHSVASAGSTFDNNEGDDYLYFKRMLEVYPKGFVSIVADTFDFWRAVTEYLPMMKDNILERDGRVVIRPDSSPKTPVELICGDEGSDIEHERKGAYGVLWDIFGGTINGQGYKVLNPKIGLIYGDSITTDRQKEIYHRLEEKGFAATNLCLGVGSYTYQFKSRDSLGFAMKASWCQINGEAKDIFKKPKTDNGTKNSLKGLCYVSYNKDGQFVVTDQCTKEEENSGLLETIFENGKLIKETSLTEIRERLCKQ